MGMVVMLFCSNSKKSTWLVSMWFLEARRETASSDVIVIILGRRGQRWCVGGKRRGRGLLYASPSRGFHVIGRQEGTRTMLQILWWPK
jgi:hypothetical protein